MSEHLFESPKSSVASSVFYGLFIVAAAAATVIAATLISMPADAAVVINNNVGPATKTLSINMNCENGDSTFPVAFMISLTANEAPVAAVIASERTGRCNAGRPASAYGAFGGTIDLHDFMINSRGGQDNGQNNDQNNGCNVQQNGESSFAIYVEKKEGAINRATLQIGQSSYVCSHR